MGIIVFLSIMIAVVAVLTSIVLIRRVKKQIAEMTDVLVDVKNGNGNRRILSATNELTAPLAYEINEIVVSYESRLSIVRQTCLLYTSPEDIHHIFKRFYRSRFSQDTQGIGLGLPLAKAIIEAHGGLIEVESELGIGTSFIMNFPIPTKL